MARSAKPVLLPEWRPDVTDLGTTTSLRIQNCVPRDDGYGPFASKEDFTQALPAGCRGYFFGRKTDGSVVVFAGTATDLYLLNNTDFSWTLVSKGSISYTQLPTTDNWQFAQFNNIVIAVQVNTPPQKYDLGPPGPTFVDLAGSPPVCGGIAIVGFFVVLTNILSAPRRVQWSDLSAPETWGGVTPGLASFQDLPDGGSTLGVSGGDAYGLVFQDASIRQFTYAPGSPVVFQINRISTQETLFAKYSIINVGNMTFYCGAGGFKMVVSGGDPIPIGKEKVDRTFFRDVDRGNLQLVIGASDPTSTRIYWAYKSIGGLTGLFDKMLCYDWALKKWTMLLVSGQYLASLAKPGVTLEQLDAIAAQQLKVTGAVVSPTAPPRIRLTLTAISNPFFSITGQNFIVVQGAVGTGGFTAACNGTWTVNVIDSTHIDLIGSTMVGAWTSGGAIGGSLDQLTFSLDSIAKASIAQLSAFGPTNLLGFFTGPNLEAIMETSDVDGEGQLLFVSALMPMTDCTLAMCSVGHRMSPQATRVYTNESGIDEMGQASVDPLEARYMNVRLRNPAGASWSYARAIEPDAKFAGDR